MPPLLASHTGGKASLPSALAPPVASAATTSPSPRHVAVATPVESPIAVALHGANVFAVAPPRWSEIADAVESIQFAAAIEEPPCFADAKIMLPGEDSACALPAEDETALALPPIAFAVELPRESEIATPVPPSEAFALAPERAPAVAFATPRVCEVANALEPAPSPRAVLVAPLPSDCARQAPRVKLCL